MASGSGSAGGVAATSAATGTHDDIQLPEGLMEQKSKVLRAIKQATKAVKERSVAEAQLEESQMRLQDEQGHLWALEIKHEAVKAGVQECVAERDNMRDESAILRLENQRFRARICCVNEGVLGRNKWVCGLSKGCVSTQ